MSADELRQAADTLRTLAAHLPSAKSETACAWETGHALQRDDGSWVLWTPKTYAGNEQADYASGAAYFATMHPGVGLALADLLDFAAETAQGWERIGNLDPSGWPEPTRLAHVLARLINGGAS